MKIILTLTFVLFFGAIAMAQNTTADTKVKTIEMGVVLPTDADDKIADKKNAVNEEVVRLHKFKNDRIKKELVFTTKYSKAKLA